MPANRTRITIGNFLGIETDACCEVAVITNVEGSEKAVGAQAGSLLARADLLGEIRTHDNGSLVFRRGITRSPVRVRGGRRYAPGDKSMLGPTS